MPGGEGLANFTLKEKQLFLTYWVLGIYLYYHGGYFLILAKSSIIRIFFPINLNRHLLETLYSQDLHSASCVGR